MKRLAISLVFMFAAGILLAQPTQSLPYATAFEDSAEFSSLWKTENTNAAGDNANGGFWIYSPDYFGVGYSGSVVFIPHPGGNVGDDWAFTPAFSFSAGSQYILSFRYATLFTGYPDKLAVFYGNNDTSAAMTNVIHDFGSYENSAFTLHSDTITISTAGTYYIGFYSYGPGGSYGGQTIDDFSLEALNTGVEEDLQNLIKVYPNPATDKIIVENSIYYQFSIRNLAGELVSYGLIDSDKYIIPLQMPAGVYIMQMTSPNGIMYSKRVGIF
jgi:hypothetical protein